MYLETWLRIFGLSFFLLLIGSISLSFIRVPSVPLLRRIARITAVVLVSLCLLATAGVFIAIRMIFGPDPPTLSELQRDFPAMRADLERLLQMSNEDSRFSRIDPKWVQQSGPEGIHQEQYVVGDKGVPAPIGTQSHAELTMPKMRWDEYRAIYKRNDIRLGVQRNSLGDIFIIVQSEGFLDSGHATGYVHCAEAVTLSSETYYRYQPCTSRLDSDLHQYTGGQEGFAFQKLAPGWYAYSQGPP